MSASEIYIINLTPDDLRRAIVHLKAMRGASEDMPQWVSSEDCRVWIGVDAPDGYVCSVRFERGAP